MKICAQKLSDKVNVFERRDKDVAQADDVFMANVLEKLEFSVGSLGENGGGKGLHDLFDGDRSACELVVGRANQAKGAHTDWLQIDITRGDLKHGTKDRKLDEVSHGW